IQLIMCIFSNISIKAGWKQKGEICVNKNKMQYPSHLQDTPDEILNHPVVGYLQGIIEDLSREIEQLKAEIRLLKDHSAKPVIPPNSNLEGAKIKSLKGVKKNSL
ncbi:MAG: hypothetical protein KAQ62_10825, partial [Cyclobacteriaceae bacterium]|nr:hypothetical protein [Cyclobacteriaceae bacterium]